MNQFEPMTYSLIDTAVIQGNLSSRLLEGAILAANMAVKPMPIEQWLPKILGNTKKIDDISVVTIVEAQYQQQYALLMANQYSVAHLFALDDPIALSEYAQGFMLVWADIESDWMETVISDGSMRMLQALLTTMMLAIDEEQTRREMRDAGIVEPPSLADMTDKLDLMINDVANSANEVQLGDKSTCINPFKSVGRNDLCPCGSGKKFKQCCLK
jgi:uncharacterized protein